MGIFSLVPTIDRTIVRFLSPKIDIPTLNQWFDNRQSDVR
jgi:hypothetical protein